MQIHPRFGPALHVQRVLNNLSQEQVAGQAQIIGCALTPQRLEDIEQCREQATAEEFAVLCQIIQLSQTKMIEKCDSLQEREWGMAHLSEQEQAAILLKDVQALIQQSKRRRIMEELPPN